MEKMSSNTGECQEVNEQYDGIKNNLARMREGSLDRLI